MKLQSVMKHNFQDLPKVEVPRSTFKRPYTYKTTFNSGYLIPVLTDEVYPGDTFDVEGTLFGRLATPIKPFMDNLWLDSFWFAVPYRLLWDNWEKFNGAQENPTDSIDYTIPQIEPPVGGWETGTLSDYFGLPILTENISVSSLYHRAYNLIYNTHFRDQDLTDSTIVRKTDTGDVDTDFSLQRRCKRGDYFTTLRPWPQKGNSPSIPISGDAPITGFGKATQTYSGLGDAYETDGTGMVNYANSINIENIGNSVMRVEEDPNNTGFPNIRANMSAVSSATINQWREAFAIQKVLERDARGGTRYTELIANHFGVTSADSRLQRPEYLGGKTSPINIMQVEQNTQGLGTGTETPQGNLAAYGTLTQSKTGFIKSFTEHCLLMCLINVRADITYQQGIERRWSKLTRYDFYLPAFAHLGEQEVLSKEIFADGTAGDDTVMGYQERWAEMRYKNSLITGALRSTATTPLDVWHLSQHFITRPTLSTTFIEENPPVQRVIAIQDEPEIVLDSEFNMKCTRALPMYSVPGQIDRF